MVDRLEGIAGVGAGALVHRYGRAEGDVTRIISKNYAIHSCGHPVVVGDDIVHPAGCYAEVGRASIVDTDGVAVAVRAKVSTSYRLVRINTVVLDGNVVQSRMTGNNGAGEFRQVGFEVNTVNDRTVAGDVEQRRFARHGAGKVHHRGQCRRYCIAWAYADDVHVVFGVGHHNLLVVGAGIGIYRVGSHSRQNSLTDGTEGPAFGALVQVVAEAEGEDVVGEGVVVDIPAFRIRAKA